MSEKKGKGKKKPKSYYLKCAHKKPKTGTGATLQANMKGFLCTCNGNEKSAVRESYSLLNEYADKMYGPEQVNAASQESDEESENDDVEDAMKKEVNAMKDTKPTERRFLRVNCKARNVIFIRTLLEDPCVLAHTILSDICQTGIQKSRYVFKLLPISGTCKCNLEDIEKLGKSLFKKDFETPFGTGLNYTIQFKKRNNTNITKEDVVPKLGRIIHELNPLHRVDHYTPDRVIVVEVIGNVCCLSILKDFFKLQKYNLIKASEGEGKDENPKSKSKTEQNELNDNAENEGNGGEESSQAEKEAEENVPPSLSANEDKPNRKRRHSSSNDEEENTEIQNTAEIDERLGRKRRHSSSSETEHDENKSSLSRETTVVMQNIPQGDTINTLTKNQTVIMQSMDRGETVVMETLSRNETVNMQTLDRDESVMDALSKGESMMDMGGISKCESTMEVLQKGESVMDSF